MERDDKCQEHAMEGGEAYCFFTDFIVFQCLCLITIFSELVKVLLLLLFFRTKRKHSKKIK